MHADPVEALAQRALRYLARRPDLTAVTWNDVYHGLKGGQSDLRADDLVPVIGLLVEHGYLRPAMPPPGGPGPVPERYDVHPSWGRSHFRNPSPESPGSAPSRPAHTGPAGRASPESPDSADRAGPISGDSGDACAASGLPDEGGEL